MSLTLDTYRQLGRSGLRVSPLALGAATFGNEWGWGAEQDEARKLFDVYVERGGNFIDTAVTYTNGTSERMLGEFAGTGGTAWSWPRSTPPCAGRTTPTPVAQAGRASSGRSKPACGS
jgi:hypothetical protein